MLSRPWSLEHYGYYYDLNVLFVPEIDGFLEREESIKNDRIYGDGFFSWEYHEDTTNEQ